MRQQLTLVRFARHDNHLAAIRLSGGRLPVIQPQPAFPIRFVPSMTLQAMLRQQRADITIEVNWCRRCLSTRWPHLVCHGRTSQAADASYQSHKRQAPMTSTHQSLSLMRSHLANAPIYETEIRMYRRHWSHIAEDEQDSSSRPKHIAAQSLAPTTEQLAPPPLPAHTRRELPLIIPKTRFTVKTGCHRRIDCGGRTPQTDLARRGSDFESGRNYWPSASGARVLPFWWGNRLVWSAGLKRIKMLCLNRGFCGGRTCWGGTAMRRAYDFLLALPDECGRMSFDQLLLMAALLTLVVAVILMISGRELA